MFKKFRKNEKGFTLAELLIVVAIIGVLVAISIPIFTSQLEKSRDATDMANIRSAIAEVTAAELSGDEADSANGHVKYAAGKYSVTVTATGKTAGWSGAATATDSIDIGGYQVEPSTKGWTVEIAKDASTVTISAQP